MGERANESFLKFPKIIARAGRDYRRFANYGLTRIVSLFQLLPAEAGEASRFTTIPVDTTSLSRDSPGSGGRDGNFDETVAYEFQAFLRRYHRRNLREFRPVADALLTLTPFTIFRDHFLREPRLTIVLYYPLLNFQWIHTTRRF